MSLVSVDIAGYRSVRRLRLPVEDLTVLVGPNGVGKTNLYRALNLLGAAATGRLSSTLALEGGLASAIWAGPRKTHEAARIVLSATLDADAALAGAFRPTYAIEIGFPPAKAFAAFPYEAQVKSERLSVCQAGRTVVLMERAGPSAWARDDSGRRRQIEDGLLGSETVLAHMRGVAGYPELDLVRHMLAQWRFYHGFRTDAASPLRQPCPGITAPILDADGANLAAVFATLRHIREDTEDLDAAIADAFPGARLEVPLPDPDARFGLAGADMPHRAFAAHELSDGTLHYLALMGALLSYRLPPLIALNEPETSLHPDLLPALARLIANAARRTQIWVVTHSRPLAEMLAEQAGTAPREVVKANGATSVAGLDAFGAFPS